MDAVISGYSDTELIVGDTNLSTGLSKTRIEALTDGIFAIAMTLMVFDIKVPTVAQMNQLNLRHELINCGRAFSRTLSASSCSVFTGGDTTISIIIFAAPTDRFFGSIFSS